MWAALLLGGLWSFCGLAGLAGCDPGLKVTVRDRYINKLPHDALREIFDAENEVQIALESVDRVKRDVEADDRDLERAKKARKRARERGGKWEDLAVGVWDARLEHLDAKRDYDRRNLKVAKFLVLVGRAILEDARARAVKKYSLDAGKIDIKEFEAQVDELRKEALTRREELAKELDGVKKLEARWTALRESYTAKTGDFDSVTWEE